MLIFCKFLVKLKFLRSKIKWDDEIDLDQQSKWVSWCQQLKTLSNISIPRWIGLTKKGTTVELHTFMDASEDAYCAAVYFKVLQGSNIRSSLVMSKSIVSPLKSLSIPRLELQAAVLGTRLSKFVLESSSSSVVFINQFYWTDSETVIKWLTSDTKKYTQFVSCRVREILENSRKSQWNWISGKLNVADMGTKLRLFDKEAIDRWLQGPKFLENLNYPIRQPSTEMCEKNSALKRKYLLKLVFMRPPSTELEAGSN